MVGKEGVWGFVRFFLTVMSDEKPIADNTLSENVENSPHNDFAVESDLVGQRRGGKNAK
jgi:hypothetical protein